MTVFRQLPGNERQLIAKLLHRPRNIGYYHISEL